MHQIQCYLLLCLAVCTIMVICNQVMANTSISVFEQPLMFDIKREVCRTKHSFEDKQHN